MKILNNPSITDVNGFLANGVACGIKKSGKLDMAMIISEVDAVCAAAFTTNKFCAAPVIVDREHLKNDGIRAVVVNSGVANACTGDKGYEDAKTMAKLVGDKLGVTKEEVFVQSTGVIGVNLPMDKIETGVDMLFETLGKNGDLAARGIMTTDLVPKVFGVEVVLDNKPIKIIGMAKGSGMIHPNMATMLSFVVTDANIEKALLQKAFSTIVDDTFNMISVDGDTSTNDMAMVMANGLGENKKITEENEDYKVFAEALQKVNEELAKKIAEDGEGATKFVEVEVSGAKSKKDAKLIAKSVVTSNLTKCAFFGEDANWGRIVCAMGYSEGDFDTNGVGIKITSAGGSVTVAENGSGIKFDEEQAKKVLGEKFLRVEISLLDGNASAKSWGCDLSYNYVKINGDYRS